MPTRQEKLKLIKKHPKLHTELKFKLAKKGPEIAPYVVIDKFYKKALKMAGKVKAKSPASFRKLPSGCGSIIIHRKKH